ncbi:MAG: DUF4405 domain-containing protein [Lachnospiraceae bacterium]|nr:DUF4405 domain-containing protein [Lachnospiraceae bacterium]
MGTKRKVRICVDFVMALLMPCLMAYSLTGEKMHKWLGLTLLLLFFLHHLLNAGWYRILGKGRYTANRILGTITNLLLLLVMVLLAVSSLILSGYVPWNIKGGIAFARLAHLASSHWCFVLVSFHLGIYWNRIFAARKILADAKIPFLSALRLVPLFYAVFGSYVFIKGQYASYMFLRVRFAFFDYGKSAVLVFAENFAVMCLFAVMGHYIPAFMNRFRKQ